jgi:DNA-binding SARP family transcriptional activator/tetratricopeptide (TPR) repeat protein
VVAVPETANLSQGELFSEEESVKLRLFGEMQAVRADETSVLPRNRKTRAVLAVLALADEKPVLRDLLIDLLWATRGRAQAQGSLRQSVHEIRHHLAGLKTIDLRSDGDRLTLRGRAIWVDAIFIETRSFQPSHAAEIVRGPLLADLFGLSRNFDDWIEAEHHRIAMALRPRMESFLASSPDHHQVTQVAECLVAFDPSFELAWQTLLKSHLATGQKAAALDVQDRCVAASRRSGFRLTFDVEPPTGPFLPPQAEAPHGQTQHGFAEAALPALRPPLARASDLPIGRARLAMAPMRALGEASADLAISVEWHFLSALQKFESLSCIPLPHGRGNEPSPQRLAAEGFDFCIESFLERWSGTDQFCLRLLDLNLGGEMVWSHRLRHPAGHAFLAQDEVTPLLAARIASEIERRRALLAENGPDQAPGLSRLILRASGAVHDLSRDKLAQANRMLAEAIRCDPRHPAPLAWQAYVQLLELGQGFVPADAGAQRRIGELIERSLALDPLDAPILAIAGHVLAFTQNRIDEGIALQERALSQNPNLPAAWMFSSLAHIYAGEHAKAVSMAGRAKLLSPSDQLAYFIDTALSLAQLMNGDPTQAVYAAQDAIRQKPNFSSPFKIGLAAMGHGETAPGTRKMLGRLLQLEPTLTVGQVVSRSPLQRHEDRQRLEEGLRLAGLPK